MLILIAWVIGGIVVGNWLFGNKATYIYYSDKERYKNSKAVNDMLDMQAAKASKRSNSNNNN